MNSSVAQLHPSIKPRFVRRTRMSRVRMFIENGVDMRIIGTLIFLLIERRYAGRGGGLAGAYSTLIELGFARAAR